jgi:hypothetical protein
MADLISRLNAALAGRYRLERQLGEGGMAASKPPTLLQSRRSWCRSPHRDLLARKMPTIPCRVPPSRSAARLVAVSCFAL